MNIKKYITQIVFIFIAILGVVSLPSTASAAELFGSAWSGNVGWITFNCATNNTCGVNNSTKYNVNITDTTGYLFGYAWNDNVGWIRFDPSVPCPGMGCSSGRFARALSGTGNISTGGTAEFTGWIDFNNVTIPSNYVNGKRNLSGYAWGGDVIGWIEMGDVYVAEPVKSVTLSPAGSTVASGSNVTLSWTAPGYQMAGTTCAKTASPANTAWSGTVTPPLNVPVTGTQSVAISATTTFTISCTNNGTTKTASQTFTVSAPASVTLSPASQTFSGGVSVPLSWTSSNFPTTGTTTCVGTTSGFSNPNWTTGNLVPVASGSRGATMSTSAGSYTYTVTCTNGAVSRSASQTYTVLAPTVTISANPTSVAPGGTTYLTWSSTNANTGSGNTTPCTATKSGGTGGSVWAGSKSASGNAVSNVVGTTSATYTLICYNGATASAPASVTVNVITPPPTVILTATPTSVSSGGATYLTWSSTNASSCTASKNGGIGGAVWSGLRGTSGSNVSNVVGGTTATYSMTCFSNANGLTSAPSTVTVTVPPPTATISASPTSVNSGGTTRLTWSSSNATGCNVTKTGGASGQSWTGTAPTAGWVDNIVGTTAATYTITCSNGSVSSAPSSAVVNISAPSAPTVTLSVSPISVNSGGTTRLTWSSTNAVGLCNATKTGGAGGQSWTGTAPTAGLVDNIVGTTAATYTITCFNSSGTSASDAKTVGINSAPASVSFAIDGVSNPADIAAEINSTHTLSWNLSNVSSCTATSNPPSGSWSGSLNINPSSNWRDVVVGNTVGNQNIYFLDCKDLNGVDVPRKAAVANLTGLKPKVTVSVTPSQIEANKFVKLGWNAIDATANTCNVSKAGVAIPPLSQPTTVSPDSFNAQVGATGTTVFRVTCLNTIYGTTGFGEVSVQVDPLTKKIKVIER